MYDKIILVTRKTRLDGLVERFNTKAQARFYIEHSGGGFSVYEREHDADYTALALLQGFLQRLTRLHVIERGFLPNYVFAETDLVVTIGIDGLVVNTAKYLNGQPIIAVNPDPAHIDGVLLPFTVIQAARVARQALGGHFTTRLIRMAEARLNDGQVLRAFNDLFVGVRSHISARYHLHFQDQEEDQSSSGIIISTGAGATGWLSSLFNMADRMMAAFGSSSEGLPRPDLAWDSDRLVFVVREPFISKSSAAAVTCGLITPESPLLLESHMPEQGLIFSDGVESDFLAFNAGCAATIGLAAQQTQLVVG
jgi:hypothetical protein